MTEAKSPVDRAMDLLVFAPVGLALSARDLLPQLVERGRKQVTGQVAVAKMLGQFAVRQGQTEAEKALGRARAQATTTLGQLGGRTDGRAPARGPEREAGAPPGPEPAGNPSPLTTGLEVVETGTAADRMTENGVPEPDADDVSGAVDTPEVRPIDVRPTPTPAPAAVTTVSPPVGALAIPDYDSLSASQVVPRLSGLSSDELEAVRAYEVGHRGRKTILSRVAQLQAAS